MQFELCWLIPVLQLQLQGEDTELIIVSQREWLDFWARYSVLSAFETPVSYACA